MKLPETQGIELLPVKVMAGSSWSFTIIVCDCLPKLMLLFLSKESQEPYLIMSQKIRLVQFTDWVKDRSDKANMSHCIRKPTKCLGENKGADQLLGNREADQRLCFRYMDSTILLQLKYKISNLTIFCDCTARFVSNLVGTLIVGFHTHRLNYANVETRLSDFTQSMKGGIFGFCQAASF